MKWKILGASLMIALSLSVVAVLFLLLKTTLSLETPIFIPIALMYLTAWPVIMALIQAEIVNRGEITVKETYPDCLSCHYRHSCTDENRQRLYINQLREPCFCYKYEQQKNEPEYWEPKR